MKAVIRGKLRALSASKKESGESIYYQLDSTPESSRTKKANRSKRSRRQEIIKFRAEISQVETNKQTNKQTKNCAKNQPNQEMVL